MIELADTSRDFAKASTSVLSSAVERKDWTVRSRRSRRHTTVPTVHRPVATSEQTFVRLLDRRIETGTFAGPEGHTSAAGPPKFLAL